MVVGDENWPFPIVKAGTSWFFDTKAGRQEILLRRIGQNELDAIEICRGYVEAQHDYALKKRVGYDVNQYAQRIISTPGKQDGLAWKTLTEPGMDQSARRSRPQLPRLQQPHRTVSRLLLQSPERSGPAAPLGELDYVIKGVMIGGFALLASPAQYKNTGVKSFIVSQDGVVYEKISGQQRSNSSRVWSASIRSSWTPVLEKLTTT